MGQAVKLAIDSHLFATPPFVADVNFAGRIVAHQYSRETGNNTVVLDELHDVIGYFGLDRFGDSFAV
jgi:hypothetical protein